MDGYVTLREACLRLSITRYKLGRLISSGKIRFKVTRILPSKKATRLVRLDDIPAALVGTEPDYIPICSVRESFSITPNAVRYHIAQGRMRWKRNGIRLAVCKQDLTEYMHNGGHQPRGRAVNGRHT